MDKGNFVGMVLLDLQKAFDTVDHDILLMKLVSLGLGSCHGNSKIAGETKSLISTGID